MNELALKAIFKMVKNMLPPDKIREVAETLVKTAINYKNENYILDTEAGEASTAGIVYEVENQVYVAIAIFDNQNTIVRFENVQPITQVIDNLISKM